MREHSADAGRIRNPKYRGVPDRVFRRATLNAEWMELSHRLVTQSRIFETMTLQQECPAANAEDLFGCENWISQVRQDAKEHHHIKRSERAGIQVVNAR